MANQKQILIIGGDNGGGSAGDQLMCEAACSFFAHKRYKVYTDAQSTSWISPIDGVKTILQLRKDTYTNQFERIFKIFLKLYRILLLPYVCKTKWNIPLLLHGNDFKHCMQHCDTILFAGCGGLSDKYPITILMWKSIVKSANRLNIPVYISGVGIGPLSSRWNINNTIYILNHVTYTTVRDSSTSLDFIKQFCSTKRYSWSPDDACFYNGSDRYNLPTIGRNKKIGISIMKSFQDSSNFQSIINYISNYFNKKDITLYLISVTHEDYGTLTNIYRQIPNCILLPKLSPSATKHAISQLDLMISSRYHGCVFALSQCIPTIGIYNELYWKLKISGVLKMFRCEENIFSLNDLDYCNMYLEANNILTNLDYFKTNLSRIIPTLKEKAYYVYKLIDKEANFMD